ncbi:hypothetical protein LZ518_12450 [Sphingomonas sp. RB56-2]|uniref:Cell envelope biogenesis protein TolA n=1 Tax=Sphingomonas brevis TaxID=2908206 RepID=A0ABT0SC07_9SPHN|nr:hypothetical protein [Sphingomonas brevis]MCL6741939.1 hypothetical protein [Sphingomonas brevis]
MKLDRAEWTGTGAALLFHVALIGALSLSLAHVASVPESPAMDVEFVEDIGETAAAPQAIAVPPPPSQAPEIGEAEPIEPAPAIQPKPQPSIVPAPAKPQPVRPAKPAPRASRIGSDFLKGIEDDDLAPRAGPSKPAAPTFNATARMSIGQAILRQVQPCADRQPFIGEGASQVRLTVNLKLARNGRLIRPPVVLRTSGDPDDRAKYGELLEDQVRRIFADCSPLRLPAELYDTPTGGWNDFTFTYRVN